MADFLEKLQKKSDREKKRITIGLSLVITAIILVLWLLSLTTGGLSVDPETEERTGSADSPIENFTNNFKTGMSEITDKISEVFSF